MNNYERQKHQAYQQLRLLEKELKLKTIMSENFWDGDIFYCAHTFDLSMSIIMKVESNEEIKAIVSEFENRYLAKVYLCVVMAGSITLLYVGPKESEWRNPEIKNGMASIFAAVYSLDHDFMVFGTVYLSSITGAPVRIG